MGFREDVKFMVNQHWEPKVPSEDVILEQSKSRLKKGKSTGNFKLDVKAIKALEKEEER